MSPKPADLSVTTDADQEAVTRAISSTPRPPPVGSLSAALTFAWRGMFKVKHVPEQLLDETITPVMFVVMFTYIFGAPSRGRPATTATIWSRASS